MVDQEVEICVVIADGDGRDYLHEHNVCCVSGYELGIENWKRIAFQYTAFELCCALKPFAIRAALDRGFATAIYTDSDIHFKASPRLILREFDHGDVLLSPHILSPIPDDGYLPSGDVFATNGLYNGGFVAVKQSENGQDFLKWWSSKCVKQCYVDVRSGVFVDQLWLNYAPLFFETCVPTRNPGINAAYWNLHERVIQYDGTAPLVNGEPLIFFHFSGFDPENENALSRYQTRFRSSDYEGLDRLVKEYRSLLVGSGCDESSRLRYAFDTLSDGTPIRKTWREAIRAELTDLASVSDPFSVDDNKNLKQRFERTAGQAALLREDWRANGVRMFLHRLAPLPMISRLWSRWVEYES
jgi:hypothetical protein